MAALQNSSVSKRVIAACMIGFISFAVMTSLFRALAPAEAQTGPVAGSPTITIPGSGNIITWGQSGGSNTIYQGERLAAIDSSTLANIKERIPAGSTVSIVKMMNDGASALMEGQFKKLLIENGYKTGGSLVGFGEYFKGYSISKGGPGSDYTITIGDPRM